MKRHVPLILAVLLGCTFFGAWPAAKRFLYPVPYLTVSEIWDNPEAWQGKRVVVRGWGQINVTDPSTQNECFPNLCQCVLNETDFFLAASSPAQKIRVQGMECMGEACPQMCIGRETLAPKAYELVGTLQVRRGSIKSLCYWTLAGLKDRDNIVAEQAGNFFSQSICRSKIGLVQQIWTPIDTYYARYFYSIALTDVDLTQSQQLVGIGGLDALSPQTLSNQTYIVTK